MATFFIQLDQTKYQAGETVTGQVLLIVPSAISGFQGISLQFTAYQSLKWITSKVIPHPSPSPVRSGQSAPVLPSNVPLEQIYHADKIEVSECESEQNSNSGLRPKYVRTANNDFYEVQYSERRNEFAKSSIRLMEGSKIPSGHYSFPFSFKTFEEWPGTFAFRTPQRKAQISYHLTARIDPVSPHYDFHVCKEVTIVGQCQVKKQEFSNQVTSFFCLGKGRSSYSLAWNEDKYSSSSNARIILSIDNSQCTADSKTISLSLVQELTFNDGNAKKTVDKVLFSKALSGVRAGEKYTDQKAIIENIDLSKIAELLPSVHGKFITSQNYLRVTLTYDALFYSSKTQSIPLQIYAQAQKIQAPAIFAENFKPKAMPNSILTIQNSFKSNQLSQQIQTAQKFHCP